MASRSALLCLRRLYRPTTRWFSVVCESGTLQERVLAPPDGTLEGSGESHAPPVEDQRVLKAAIVGVPNAGKSTLVNQLLRWKLFAVSPKRHTTTRNTAGVFTEGNSQVIIMDTPGIVPYRVGRKIKASRYFKTGPQRSLMEAQLVMVIVDVSNKRTRDQLHPEVVQVLGNSSHTPAVLVLNKVDMLRHKHKLLEVTEALTGAAERAEEMGWKKKPVAQPIPPLSHPDTAPHALCTEGDPHTQSMTPHTTESMAPHTQASPNPDAPKLMLPDSTSEYFPQFQNAVKFDEVFMVSSLTGNGVDDLRTYLLGQTRPGAWEYSVGVQSDQTDLQLVEDIIQEKLFLHLHKEIPYSITQSSVQWERNGDTLVIYQNLTCRSRSQVSIAIGPAGRTIQAITAEAKGDIEALLGCPVDLTLNLKAQS